MSQLQPEPPRWRDEREQTNVAERAAGETLRFLPQREPLTDVQLARIAARIRATKPRSLHRLVLVAAALLLGVATAASAAHLDILPAWIAGTKLKAVTSVPHDAPKIQAARRGRLAAADDLPGANEPVPATPQAPAVPSPPAPAADPSAPAAAEGRTPPAVLPSPRKPAPKSPAPATEAAADKKPPAPSFVPEPAGSAAPPTGASPAEVAAREPTAVGPAPARPARPSAPVATAAPAAPGPETAKPALVPSEPKREGGAAKYLTQTIRVLRVEHDAKTALALLDRHAAQLSRSALGHEALLLRVEALLALGREDEVLRLLDGAALTDVAASHSLLVTRGRLRAAANRCADGVGDFSLVLAESRPPDRQALFGRALCRQRLGDHAGARADLERFRREFPTDPRLDELERRLGAVP